jgi:FkbM family methyltransferase
MKQSKKFAINSMKFLYFFNLGFTLCSRIYFIYFKKIIGKEINVEEYNLLTYANKIIKSKFKHLSVEAGFYKVGVLKDVQVLLRQNVLSDYRVLEQIWQEEELKDVVQKLNEQFKKDNLYIIDAGANIGLATIYLNYHLKNKFNLNFIAIEPDGSNIESVKSNFKLNNINATSIEQKGLFNKLCYLNILDDFRDGQKWSLRVEESLQPTAIQSTEISELIKQNNWPSVDFLKMDIEGSEKYLFEDKNYIDTLLQQINCIAVEVHPEYISEKEVAETLNNNHFTLSKTGEYLFGQKNEN